MTTETDTKATDRAQDGKTDVDQGQPRELTQEEKDAKAGFQAGYLKVRGVKPGADTTTDAKVDDTADTGTQDRPADKKADEPASQQADAAAKKAAAEDPWKDVPPVVRQQLEALSALPQQIRNLAGQFGTVNAKVTEALKSAKATAAAKGGDAPSDKQIEQAMADPKAWTKLQEDYPDWAGPLQAEFGDIRKQLDALGKKGGQQVDVAALRKEVTGDVTAAVNAGIDVAEERAFIRMKHPGWKTTINTKEFKEWSLQGGPSLEQYQQMKQLEQSDPDKATAMVNGWTRTHPQWWADRGHAIFDDRAEGAIKLLDGFKDHNERLAAQPKGQKQDSTRRLASAVPAKSSGAAATTSGISDEAAFKRGYNNVRRAANPKG